MNNLKLGLAIFAIFVTILGSAMYSYTHSDVYINSNIRKLNDKYTFDDDGYQTITAKYAYKEETIKIDVETSPLPGSSVMTLHKPDDIVTFKFLDKDKFDMAKASITGEDFTPCGNGGSYCATVTIPVRDKKATKIRSVEPICDTRIFEDNKLIEAMQEAANMLY